MHKNSYFILRNKIPILEVILLRPLRHGLREIIFPNLLTFPLTSSFLDPRSLRIYCGIYDKNSLAGSCEEDRQAKNVRELSET